MGVSILDAHPNNECINLDADEVWFSFVFCGSHIDRLNLHAYDYYTGDEILTADNITVYEEVPALENKLGSRRGVGNGVRVNIKEFVKDTSVFSSEGEYTWRAELVQTDDNPDNMVYEGVLPGDPNFTTHIGNIKGLDLDHYLPLADCIKNKIRPPYYVDFLDDRGFITAYDVPVTYDEVKTNSDGTQSTVIQVDTYTSVSGNTKSVVRPAIGTEVYVHKKKY